MVLRDVTPVLVGTSPVVIAEPTNIGIVLLSIMTIKALLLCVSFAAITASESEFRIMRRAAAIRNSVVDEGGGITKAS